MCPPDLATTLHLLHRRTVAGGDLTARETAALQLHRIDLGHLLSTAPAPTLPADWRRRMVALVEAQRRAFRRLAGARTLFTEPGDAARRAWIYVVDAAAGVCYAP